jgi:anti-sigma factor RsiW
MTCDAFEDWILDEIDGELRDEFRELLEAHLGTCASCRAFRAGQIELDRGMRDAGSPELSPQFAVRVLDRIDSTSPRRVPFRLDFALDLAGLGGIAAAVAFCVAHWFPGVMVGAPWVAAGTIVCGGICLVSRETETPE